MAKDLAKHETLAAQQIVKRTQHRHFGPIHAKAELLRLYDVPMKIVADVLEVDVTTVGEWEHKGNWKKKRERFLDHLEGMAEDKMLRDVASITWDQLSTYQKMQKKGEEALDKLEPQTSHEAVELIQVGIRGWREITRGGISQLLIDQVARILQKHVQDPTILRAIAQDLQATLSPPRERTAMKTLAGGQSD